jgi:hypothetical protein
MVSSVGPLVSVVPFRPPLPTNHSHSHSHAPLFLPLDPMHSRHGHGHGGGGEGGKRSLVKDADPRVYLLADPNPVCLAGG